MIKIIFIYFFAISSAFSQTQSSRSPESLVLPIPVLSPSEAVKLAENYLVQVKRLDKRKFRLGGVSFEYFSTIPAPPGVIATGWNIWFECVPNQLDCRYGVGISNTKKPKIVMYPVR
jgi:hypothetical protein